MRFGGHGRPTPRAATGFLAALALAGCDGPLSTLDPAGPGAGAIAALWWGMLAGAVLILAGVMLLLAHALRPAPRRRPVSERALLGGAGILFPVAVLTVLLVFALRTGEALLPRDGAGERPLVVEARGHQWWWEFTYPDFEGGPLHTAGELHVPTGRPVHVRLSAADVIHSFWVPRLGGKLDAVPGHVTTLRLEVERPGTYPGRCAEFCGLQHSLMGFSVVAHAPGDFADRLRALAAPPPSAAPAAFTASCGACHATDARERGNGAPNLAGVMARAEFGGGALANRGPDDLARWLREHPVRKPGSREPHHGLLEAAVAREVLDYLETLR